MKAIKGGADSEQNIVIEQPEIQESKLVDCKEPIFIGQILDKDLLNRIDDLIDKEKFELAILPDSIQQSCRETYFFSKLNEKERNDMLASKRDRKLRQETLDAIYQVEELFKKFFEEEGVEKKEGQSIVFTPYELKNVIHKYRRQALSNQDLRNMIEKMQIYGFLTPMKMNEAYHKQEFAITIEYTDRLAALTAISNIIEYERQVLKQRKELYDDQILKLSVQLNNSVADMDAAEKYELTLEEQQVLNAVKMAMNHNPKVRLKEILPYCQNRKQQSVANDLKKLVSLKLVKCLGTLQKTYFIEEIN